MYSWISGYAFLMCHCHFAGLLSADRQLHFNDFLKDFCNSIGYYVFILCEFGILHFYWSFWLLLLPVLVIEKNLLFSSHNV